MFLMLTFVYWLIRPFGPDAQAGYGIGSRIMQAIFLPTMALAFAVAPVAGQNFGARQFARVRETFRSASTMGVGLMIAATAVCQLRPQALVQFFSGVRLASLAASAYNGCLRRQLTCWTEKYSNVMIFHTER